MFIEAGYYDIGMDHFALAHDDLYIAKQQGTLHRNFMGYTLHNTSMLIGLGVSAISDIGLGYAQNYKTLHDYEQAIDNGKSAVTKGIFLTEEDTVFRNYILDISCKGHTIFREEDIALLGEISFPLLEELANDGLVQYNQNGLQVTARGNHFIRNICYPFDLHVQRKKVNSQQPRFSNAI